MVQIGFHGKEPSAGEDLGYVLAQLLIVPRIEVRLGHQGEECLLVTGAITPDAVSRCYIQFHAIGLSILRPDHLQLGPFKHAVVVRHGCSFHVSVTPKPRHPRRRASAASPSSDIPAHNTNGSCG